MKWDILLDFIMNSKLLRATAVDFSLGRKINNQSWGTTNEGKLRYLMVRASPRYTHLLPEK